MFRVGDGVKLLMAWSCWATVATVLAACAEPIVLSGYGSRYSVHGRPARRARQHRGVDYRGALHSPVLAAADGVVWMSYFDVDTGFVIVVAHPGARRWTHYAHLERVDVKVDAAVVRGQVIGAVGLYKASGGIPHVHMQLCTSRLCVNFDAGSLGGTEDPLAISAGCFDPRVRYPVERLVLTYPVPCHQ